MSRARDPERTTAAGLCALAGFTRQAFYKERRVRRRAEVDREALVELVKAQRRIHPRIGARKILWLIQADMAEMGIEVGRDRFFALLRGEGLLIKRGRRRAQTTDSRHGFRVYPNRIRHIAASTPHQVWVSDLTYIRTDQGFLYLSLITDAWSRKIVGFDTSDSLEAEGCLRSLRMAVGQLTGEARPIHHSDRGTQYCCRDYIELLESRNLAVSMTERNHCYENSQAERVNGILKREYSLGETFRTKAQGKAAAIEAVGIYNDLRPHLALDYQTPSSAHAREAAV